MQKDTTANGTSFLWPKDAGTTDSNFETPAVFPKLKRQRTYFDRKSHCIQVVPKDGQNTLCRVSQICIFPLNFYLQTSSRFLMCFGVFLHICKPHLHTKSSASPTLLQTEFWHSISLRCVHKANFWDSHTQRHKPEVQLQAYLKASPSHPKERHVAWIYTPSFYPSKYSRQLASKWKKDHLAQHNCLKQIQEHHLRSLTVLR